MGGFEDRMNDPDFERIRARVKDAVKSDPALREKVDQNEAEFCRIYDRLAGAALREKIALHEKPRDLSPAPRRGEPSEEEQARRRSLDRLGAIEDNEKNIIAVGEYLSRHPAPQEED